MTLAPNGDGTWRSASGSGGGSINVFSKERCELNLSQFKVKAIHPNASNFIGGSGTVNVRSN